MLTSVFQKEWAVESVWRNMIESSIKKNCPQLLSSWMNVPNESDVISNLPTSFRSNILNFIRLRFDERFKYKLRFHQFL